jgi:hypothetical protein
MTGGAEAMLRICSNCECRREQVADVYVCIYVYFEGPSWLCGWRAGKLAGGGDKCLKSTRYSTYVRTCDVLGPF